MTMLTMVLGLAFQAQTPVPPTPQEPPLQNETVGGRTITPAHETFEEDFVASDAGARIAIHNYGRCVASSSGSMAADVLARDFTTAQYRRSLQVLSQNNADCFRRRGRMRSSSLLFAGAMAEHLIEQPTVALNVRLARASARPAIQGFSPTDRVVGCVVRSVPDDVALLLATEVASAAEVTAAQSLGPVMSHCNTERRPISVSPAGLRAMLATAAFRTLQAAGSETAQ